MNHEDDANPVGEPHSTPRWVKVFGAIAILIVVLFILLLLFGGGKHGPRRHMQTGQTATERGLG